MHNTNQTEEAMRPFEIQGEQWGRHAAVWASEMEIQMQPLFESALKALGPLAGRRLLDAGCGTGLAASLALAGGASVTGIDASPAFAQFAGERSPAAEFRVGDVQELPYADGAFDFVTAFNSIQYAPDPERGVAELARVCAPGGSVAIGVWGDPAQCETDALFARLRSIAPPPPGTPTPLQISELGRVEALLEAARLTISGGGDVSCPFVFRDIDHAWAAHSSAGPLQKVIDAVGAENVRDTLASVLEADRKPDGQLRQDNAFRYVVATKPASGV
jgi:SAM-dependent methyltransferase